MSILSLKLSEACLTHGTNVSLRCHTDGFPRPSIQFLQDDVTVTPGEGIFENFNQEYFDQVK